MAKKQSQRRGKSGNASGRTVKEATGGLKKPRLGRPAEAVTAQAQTPRWILTADQEGTGLACPLSSRQSARATERRTDKEIGL